MSGNLLFLLNFVIITAIEKGVVRMNRDCTGVITKITTNEEGMLVVEIVTIPNFNNYDERILTFELPNDEMVNNFPFCENDLVRFDENNMSDMVRIPSADFDYLELSSFAHVAQEANEEEIEELHKCLKGLTYESSGKEIDASEEFMNMLLNYNFGKASPVDMPPEYIKFFNSEYVSNFYKTMLINKVIVPYNVTNVDLSGKRGIKDLTGEEWNTLYEIITSNPQVFGRTQDYYNGLFPLALQIDSEGARDFINNYMDQIKVIKRIMRTSGLTPDPSYYSGRGTRLSDLTHLTLFAIFLKLEKLDENKGYAMAQLAYNMKTLGATEFITSLYSLVKADYDIERINVTRSNISFDGVSHDDALGMLMVNYAELLNSDTCLDDYLTRQIKLDFIDLHNRYLAAKYLGDGLDVVQEDGICFRSR